jgi:hypothetical protein
VHQLIAAEHPDPASLRHLAAELRGDVLMRAEIIDDLAAAFAEDHGVIETAHTRTEAEAPGVREGLSSQSVDIGVVREIEPHVPAGRWQLKSAHPAEREHRWGDELASRHEGHHAVADLGEVRL